MNRYQMSRISSSISSMGLIGLVKLRLWVRLRMLLDMVAQRVFSLPRDAEGMNIVVRAIWDTRAVLARAAWRVGESMVVICSRQGHKTREVGAGEFVIVRYEKVGLDFARCRVLEDCMPSL